MPNALAQATSPYLRQHAENPVDWLPWGEEAFAKARQAERPIFLSIGYSTCHWCHVMAHESFENAAIAGLLNAHFVPIKVDREERPDVDRVYMAYVQALTGHGGWPLSAWLTPDLKPFYAGTYFPPADRDGRAGFPSILKAIARGWREDRGHLVAEAGRVVAALGAPASGKPADGDPASLAKAAGPAFERALEYYGNLFDGKNGGFGGAPKFPRPGNLAFLLRCAALQGPATEAGREAAGMAAATLRGMARGGIHDHVGGGFHRYSVDADWFVPHFEKMLYDQAQIASVALDAWQATGDERHAWLARDALDYVLRDLTSPEGGFYAAEDADSGLPGGGHAEGAFYVWTLGEIEGLLGSESAFFALHFGVLADGNVPVELDPHREFAGRNILSQPRPLDQTAERFGISPEEASARLVGCLERLREARARRPRPHLDDKVITAWNGLTITAFARASAMPAESLAERQPAYREAAIRAATLLEGRFFDAKTGILQRSGCRGAVSGAGFAEDYAFLVAGLLDLYEATFDVHWLAWADGLQQAMDARFWDAGLGGYFNSPDGAADVVVRLKEDYDGAEPAASSIAAANLLRLSAILGDEARRERGRKTVAAFRAVWEATPHAMPQMLCALEPALDPPRHIVLTGDPATPEFQALNAVIRAHSGPRRSVIALDAPGAPGARAWFSARAPWLRGMGAPGSPPAAYVCEHYTCRAPTGSTSDLKAMLG